MYDEIGRDGTEYRFVKYEDWYPANDEGGLTNILSESVDAYVTLVHKNNKIEVPFSVIWKDQNNRDAQRPDYVTVALMAYQWNGTLHTWEVTEKATATVPSDEINTMTADEWAGTFGEQEMYHDGIKVIYHLSVTSDLNAYIPEGSFEYGWVESAYGNQLDAVPQVTVSQNINTVTVPATVYWDDNGNNDGIRPTNIVLQLYAHEPGGTPVPVAGQAYRVNLTGDPKADNWNYTFSGMPKYAEGRSGVELIYTVQIIEAEGEPLYGYN